MSPALWRRASTRLQREAGFEDVSAEVTHTYDTEVTTDAECCGGLGGCCGEATTLGVEELASAFMRGRKPAERVTP